MMTTSLHGVRVLGTKAGSVRILTALVSAALIGSTSGALGAQERGAGPARPPVDFDVGVRKTAAGTLTAGQTATFTLSPFNTGPSPVDGGSGVVVTDVLPANFAAPVTANGAGWTCTVAGLTITCSYGGPAVNGHQPLPVITVTAVAQREGRYRNCAEIALKPRDTNPRDNNACVEGEIRPEAAQGYDVSIRKRGPEGPLSVGQTATFTLNPHNNGPSSVDNASGVVVTDVLPANFTAPVTASGAGWACTVAGLTITCSYGGPAVGAGQPFPAITITAVAKGEGRYENCAEIAFRPKDFPPRGGAISVGGEVRDANPRDNRDCIRSEVTPEVAQGYDVSIRKQGPEGPVTVGQTATFTLNPHNNGPSSVNGGSGVVVTDVLPANFTAPVTASGAGWACTVAGLTVTCSFGGSAVGAGQPLPAITITAVAKGEGRYENCAEIAFRPRDGGPRTGAMPPGGGVRDTNPRDNRDCIRGEVTGDDKEGYDVGIRKQGPEGPVTVGQTATFTLSPFNTGPSPVDGGSGVVVTDVLPGNFSAPITANGAGWTCTVAGLTITCAYGGSSVGAGQPFPAITITAVAQGEGGYRNCADISLKPKDNNPRDNRDCVEGGIETGSKGHDVSIRKLGGETTPVGGQVSFTLNPFNNGPDPVASVTVTDALPAGLTGPVMASGAGWTCTVGQVVTCVYSTGTPIGPGLPFPPITLQATGQTAGDFTNCATVAINGTTDTNPQDNTDCRDYVVTGPQTGTITIVKDAQPNGPQWFAFTPSLPGIPGFKLDDDPTSATFSHQNVMSGLDAGSYAFTEGTTPGWTLTGVVCTSAPSPGRIFDRWGNLSIQTVTVELEPGDNIICTFTNVADEVPPPTATGTLTIVKEVQPGDHAQDFTFTTVGAGLSDFSLDDDPSSSTPSSQTFTNLLAGPYTVTEDVLNGWMVSGTGYQGSLNCGHVGPTASAFTPSGNSVTVNLVADDHVTCTFINTQTPAPAAPDLGITKVGVVTETAAGQAITYTIVITNPGGTTPSGTIHLIDLLSGFPAGTIYNSASGVGACSPPVPGTPWDCEVPASNLGLPITIEIVVPPGGGSVTNCATVVLAGDPNDLNNEACVTNTVTPPTPATGTITIMKNAVPDDPQDFFFLFGTGGGSFVLDDDGGASNPYLHHTTLAGLATGSWTFTENAVSGWSLTGIVCTPPGGHTVDLANRKVTVGLTAGAHVTCTFTNVLTPTDGTPCDDGNVNTVNDAWVNGVCTGTPTGTGTGTGTLTIVKDVDPGSDPQDFHFTAVGAGLNDVWLDDDPSSTMPNSVTFTNLALGVPFTVTEDALSPWTVPSLQCYVAVSGLTTQTTDQANRTFTVTLLDPGANVTCVFTNVR